MSGDHAGRLSRRQLLAGALGAGGAAALVRAAPAVAQAQGDGALLTAALQFERLSLLAYREMLRLPVLSPHDRRVLTELLTQDRAHAQALELQLTALGMALPAPPAGPGEVDHALSTHGMSAHVSGVKDLKGAVGLLLDIEGLCAGGYYTAVEKLASNPSAVQAAQMLASEGQHQTLLSELLHPGDSTQAVPSWYVAGIR